MAIWGGPLAMSWDVVMTGEKGRKGDGKGKAENVCALAQLLVGKEAATPANRGHSRYQDARHALY